MYAAPALHVNVKQINELNVCWNLILLHRIQFYRRIFYANDNVLHKLFCALLLSDCMHDNCMISVFTRDAVRNVYMQFRADLTV